MIVTYTKPGLAHVSQGVPCQDEVFFLETKDLIILTLADGVSQCRNSRQGAQTACIAGAEYLGQFYSSLTQCPEEKLSFLLLDQVDFCLRELALRLDCAPESLSSTLMACCVRKDTRACLVFSLGDGAAYLLNDRGPELILAPRHLPGGGTATTMTRGAHRAAALWRGTLPPDGHIFLCSDGACQALNQDEGAVNSLILGEFEDLRLRLEDLPIRDDASFIAV